MESQTWSSEGLDQLVSQDEKSWTIQAETWANDNLLLERQSLSH